MTGIVSQSAEPEKRWLIFIVVPVSGRFYTPRGCEFDLARLLSHHRTETPAFLDFH
jgi:hypothetical protein